MNAEYEKAIGQNIRKLRMERNLSQEQLSAKLQVLGCDLTRSALAKIEVGQRHIYPDELKLLREILGISYEELFVSSPAAPEDSNDGAVYKNHSNAGPTHPRLSDDD